MSIALIVFVLTCLIMAVCVGIFVIGLFLKFKPIVQVDCCLIFVVSFMFATMAGVELNREHNRHLLEEWKDSGYEVVAIYSAFSTKVYPDFDTLCGEGAERVFLTESIDITNFQGATYALCK